MNVIVEPMAFQKTYRDSMVCKTFSKPTRNSFDGYSGPGVTTLFVKFQTETL